MRILLLENFVADVFKCGCVYNRSFCFPVEVVFIEGSLPEWYISTIIACLRYTILVWNPQILISTEARF